MKLDRITATVAGGDSTVVTRIGVSGRVRLVSGGALTLEADDAVSLAVWLEGAAAQARALVATATAASLEVRFDELVVGDRIAAGPDSGAIVTGVWAPVAGHAGYGLIGLDGHPRDCWGRHLVWVVTPRPGAVDEAADAAVDAAAVWQDESTWHDVIVGDTVRLAGEWLTVMTVGPDRIRSGMTKVRLTDERGGVSVVSVEPADAVTVRYPRAEASGAVAS